MKARLAAHALFPVLVGVFVLTLSAVNVSGQDQNKAETGSMFQSNVLRHRIQIVAVSPDKKEREGVDSFILKTDGWRALLLHEGVSINQEEWANALDLFKIEAGKSSVFRLVNIGIDRAKKEGAEQDDCSERTSQPLFILARFGVGTVGNRVFINLIDGSTGNTILTADHFGASMQQAIRKALVGMEEEVALMTWRCRVVGQGKNAMIIDRGRLDGLRRGQQLIGYAMDANAKQKAGMDPELMIMQFGTRKGLYEISEEGQEFCKATPVANAPLLSTGDILELPSVKIPDRQRDTRDRRVWDKIYNR